MPHKLTRAKALQNAAFLRRLEATGNVRLAAEQAGVFYRTMQRRRAAHGAFRQRWDAALLVAQARLGESGPASVVVRGEPPPPFPRGGEDRRASRTRGGEAIVVRRKDGRLQVRRAHPGRLTKAAEQQFLLALSATCNVRLAAAAAGTQTIHFYRRKQRDKSFAREWLLALEEGYARLELACLEAALPEAHAQDGWSHNDPPALPPMTANQALQLMYLHQKEARLQAEPPHMKRRRGESAEAYSYRLAVMYEARQERARERFRIAEAARHARGQETFLPWEPPVALPDLAQVTGWSRAGEAKAHDERRALFGGWRIEDRRGKLRDEG